MSGQPKYFDVFVNTSFLFIALFFEYVWFFVAEPKNHR